MKRVQEEITGDFKFMCNAILLTKGDSAFHMSASCFWEHKTDGNFNKKYDFEDYFIIVNFFGVLRE